MIDYKEVLKEHSIAPSLQRIKILEFLEKNRAHPTAKGCYCGAFFVRK
jgi:Fe2+ or Zn2+ uptake regulation protein